MYGQLNNLIQRSPLFLPLYHQSETEFVRKGVRYLVLELSSDTEYFFPIGTSQSMVILKIPDSEQNLQKNLQDNDHSTMYLT